MGDPAEITLERAEQQARANGHMLGPWRQICNANHARCIACQQMIWANVETGIISGAVVVENCRGRL